MLDGDLNTLEWPKIALCDVDENRAGSADTQSALKLQRSHKR